MKNRRLQGFTLIELLVVIGILAVLLAIVLIAINPARQFAQANNTQRRSDVNAILNAVHQYMADNNGTPPTNAPAAGASAAIANTGSDICASLVTTYMADLPLDPTAGTKTPATAVCTAATAYNTGYMISRSGTDNRFTISAPSAELGEVITVTR